MPAIDPTGGPGIRVLPQRDGQGGETGQVHRGQQPFADVPGHRFGMGLGQVVGAAWQHLQLRTLSESWLADKELPEM